jgi:hypothetical protein
MEDNEIAAKRHKQRKTDCVYGPFASFRGYSLFPWCRLGCGLISNYTGRGHHLSFRPAHRSGWGQPVPIGFAQRGTSRPHPEKSSVCSRAEYIAAVVSNDSFDYTLQLCAGHDANYGALAR